MGFLQPKSELCIDAQGNNFLCHLIKVGLRLVEECQTRIKEKIGDDPLCPVAGIYEEQITNIK